MLPTPRAGTHFQSYLGPGSVVAIKDARAALQVHPAEGDLCKGGRAQGSARGGAGNCSALGVTLAGWETSSVSDQEMPSKQTERAAPAGRRVAASWRRQRERGRGKAPASPSQAHTFNTAPVGSCTASLCSLVLAGKQSWSVGPWRNSSAPVACGANGQQGALVLAASSAATRQRLLRAAKDIPNARPKTLASQRLTDQSPAPAWRQSVRPAGPGLPPLPPQQRATSGVDTLVAGSA